MKRLLTLILGAIVILPAVTGCNLFNRFLNPKDPKPLPPVTTKAGEVDAASLVRYLNENAARCQSIQANVDIDAKAGNQSIGLGGFLAARGPRDFRLRGKVLGQPAVDLGSNEEKFWYWIGKSNPPHYYFCTYKDLGTGKVNVPFPVETDMVMAALGMAKYDSNGKYELKVNQSTYELTQDADSPSGHPVKRVTVFRSTIVPGEPQVLEHHLRDVRGTLICKATVQKVYLDPGTKAIVSKRVTIEYPSQKVQMTLDLSDIQVNRIDQAAGDRMFTLGQTPGHDQFDLARNSVISPSSLRQASPRR